jgi:hypothetical protein
MLENENLNEPQNLQLNIGAVRRSIFWVFSHYINGTPVFERSTSYEYRAKERIKELKDWYGYTEAFYSTELPKKYFA